MYSANLLECAQMMQWEGGRVMGMGWTSSENLVCILEEGTMAVYTIHGHLLYTRLISRVSLEIQCACMYMYDVYSCTYFCYACSGCTYRICLSLKYVQYSYMYVALLP